MNFDKCKVYTALNAARLKIGSKVIVADSLGKLKNLVTAGDERNIHKLLQVNDEDEEHRFKVDNGYDYSYTLAYLVEEPVTLKWTDLKIGDIICKENVVGKAVTYMVTAIDPNEASTNCHIYAGDCWICQAELKYWRKVEK